MSPRENCRNRRLTERELQVLRLIALGYSTKQIAAELGIACATAAFHRSRIYGKLNVHTAHALVHYAIQNEMVKP